MNQIYENSTLSSFLSRSKYRFWRYSVLIVIIAVITFNMVLIAYQDSSSVLGFRIYLIGFILLLVYLFIMWLNYSVLVPKLLLKNRYTAYLIILSAIILILPLLTIVQEYAVRSSLGLPHRINSYTNPLILIDSLSSFVLIFICLFGIPVMVFLRRWMAKREEVSRMENERISAEINKLKGQFSPDFLSKTLKNAESSIQSDPDKTSKMLIKLGELLRYQLYDCNRDKVLIGSEINFITNFFELEQLERKKFQYRINTGEKLTDIFVAPMLFISIIQALIENSNFLEITFRTEAGLLFFECQSGNHSKLSNTDFMTIKKRLELQYPDKYNLRVESGRVTLQLNIPI